MLKPDRLSVYQACPSRPPSQILKSLCPLLRTMITYKKVQVLYHSEAGLSNYRRVMFVEKRKLPGRQLFLSGGESSEGEGEVDQACTEQHQGYALSICHFVIPMSEFPLLFDRFLFHGTPHRSDIATRITQITMDRPNSRSTTVTEVILQRCGTRRHSKESR